MKKRILSALTVLLLAGLLTFGAVGTLVSTYVISLPLTIPILASGIACFLSLLLLPRRHGPEVLLCLTALCLGFVCTLPETQEQTKGLLMYLTQLLDNVYHLGYLVFPGVIPGRMERPLTIYCCLLSLSVCRTLLRRRSCLLPLLLCLPSLLLCAGLPGAMPAILPLLCWIAGVMLLLLSSGSWKIGAAQGTQLALTAAIPVVALCCLLFALNPQAEYEDHAAGLRQNLLSRAEKNLGVNPLPAAVIPAPQRTADLSALTGWNQAELPVLIVTAPDSGVLYLRGQDFTRYTGLGWEADAQETEAFSGWGDSDGEVSIRTFALHGVLYLPYFPDTGTVLTGGDLENRGGLLSYRFSRYPNGSAAPENILSECRILPESTAAWASQYSFSGSSPGEIAAAIGDFVRQSATYDKQTGQIPATETDFAKWFLESSDTGFCVHFATAAVVLLRAQGIPARYVTGYLTTVEADTPKVVTSLQAHAWAEYYDSALGAWQILEATAPEQTTRPATQWTAPATQATTPTAVSTDATAVPETKSNSGTLWGWLLALPALVLILYLRRLTVLYLRRRRRENASVNRRCLLWWAEAQHLSRPLGSTPPEALLNLAERARYSQHRLTPMDLTPLEAYCAQCRRDLDAQTLWKRLVNKYILVLY